MPEDIILMEQAAQVKEDLAKMAQNGVVVTGEIHFIKGKVSFIDHYLSNDGQLVHVRTDS